MLIFFFIIGTVFGSFLGLVSERWDTEASILYGRSQCSSCQSPLKWYQLIPLISQIIFKSKCRLCGVKFSYSYFILEFLSGTLFAALWFDLDFLHFFTLIISLLLSKFDIDSYAYPLNIGLAFTACLFHFFYQYWDWCWRYPVACLCLFFSLFRRNAYSYPAGFCIGTLFFAYQKKEKDPLYSFS
ncbi:prepilin peptidase [Lactococcus formosensis subsp. bovis]|uniref:prepilin peptidase n=1 Tax=Lactococcus formosensis TaxID=1281486 RepID=UPI0020BDE870|nr:prepilin peptidase [Lactococcus formosensis]